MRRPILILLIFFSAWNLSAEKIALMIAMRGGSPELDAELVRRTAELEHLLKQEGRRVLRADTLQGTTETMRSLGHSVSAEDELEVYLFGHASANSKRISLPLKGGRMSGTEFAALLNGIRGTQTVFLLHTQSAALFDLLAKGRRTVAAASDDPGQLGAPYYPALFLIAKKELGANAEFLPLLRRAGELTEQYYRSHSLAVAENSQFYRDGRRMSYPFGGTAAGTSAVASEPERESSDPDLRSLLSRKTVIRPATPERLKKLEEIRKTVRVYQDYAYVVTARSVRILLNPDRSAELQMREVFYMNSSDFAPFGSLPPGGVAEVIFPDGRYAEYRRSVQDIPLTAGSLVERRYSRRVASPSHLPELHIVLPLQGSVPVLASEIVWEVPNSLAANAKLYASGVNLLPAGKNQYKTGPMEAAAPLYAGDAFVRESAGRFVMTTLKNWDELHSWMRRMTDRSLELDGATADFTRKLVRGARTDAEKVRVIYEFLNAMRYQTTPVGAAAFRPRPAADVIASAYGDCKDKATAFVAMCGALGIKAYRALLNRGGTLDQSFPSWQFNHMLVYVPELEGYPDGLWLDPTDVGTPFGDLPPGDHQSFAMILLEKSYAFKKVTLPAQGKNYYSQQIDLEKKNGSMTGTIVISSEGIAAVSLAMNNRRVSPELRASALASDLERILPGFTAESHEFSVRGAERRLCIRASSPDDLLFLSSLPFPWKLEQYFGAGERKRPARITDGRPLTVMSSIRLKGAEWGKLVFRRSNRDFSISVAAEQDTLRMRMEFRGSDLTPESCREIRRILLETKTQLKKMDAARAGKG